MIVYIPTMGRVNNQDTYTNLTQYKDLPYEVVLVCPQEELGDHLRRDRKAIAPPDSVQRIAATRDWIIHQSEDQHVVMMDDDLTFAKRREDEPDKFMTMSGYDTVHMLVDLEELLEEYAHVGIAMREGANRDTTRVKECTRMARVIGYDVDVFYKEDISFLHGTVMDDFEVTLQLLTKGYKNGILNSYVQNQRSSGAPGGASIYRDLEMHKAAALKLAERWPDFVRPVEKTTKTAWNGATRTDVIVQWKKAYGSSQ